MLVLSSADEYKLKAVTDILQSKLVKRGLGPVDVLKGGLAAWQQQQFPVERR